MNVVKSPEGFLRNQDAINTNLMAVLIHTWIEVMKLQFEEEDFSEKQ